MYEPGDVLEVSKERFESLGDSVEAYEGPEPGEESKSILEYTAEDLKALKNKDALNDLAAGIEGLEIESKMTRSEMEKAILAYIESQTAE